MATTAEQLAARVEVAKSVSDIFQAALRCAELCARFDVPLPDAVASLLGVGKEKTNTGREGSNGVVYPAAVLPKRTFAPLKPPYRIERQGWVSFPLADARTPTRLVLALREAGKPLRQSAVISRTGRGYSSVIAALDKLEASGGLTGRATDEMRLVDSESLPRIIGDRVWGPPEAFMPHEIAVHRREGILAALAAHGPLFKTEINDVLAGAEWVHAPVVPSLIVSDLEFLSTAKRIRRGESTDYRWHLAEVQAEDEAQKGPPLLRLAKQM